MYGIILLNLIYALASVATAIGVFLAWRQLRLTKEQAITQFEDSMAKEYRELAAKIPTKALLGEALNAEEYEKTFDEFYHYIDLSNEEVFLRQQGRISQETWSNWLDGIKSNLSRPAFRKAWEEIKSQAKDSFKELRDLEASGFKDDPLKWKND
jgi:hypothetical protein